MDELDDTFFSPEALRLLQPRDSSLDGQQLELAGLWGTSSIGPTCDNHGSAAAALEAQKRAPRSRKRAAPGYSMFPATADRGPSRKRAKLEDPKRRAEVAQVRKEGACLRCRWNKSSCSDCVHEDYDIILQSGFLLISEHIELDFNELVKWDIDALSIDFATWMAVDNVSSAATSRVGILSSVECQGLLLKYLDDDLCTSFRLLIKASSLLYNHTDHPHPQYDHEQLDLIRASAGAKLLVSLETALKNTVLAKASKEKLMSLFLVLLGAIIAITYTPATGFEEARYELLRIMAHHMIFIAERIDLVDCDATKNRLTASCHNLWDKTGGFDWNYTVDWLVEGVKIGVSPEMGNPPVDTSCSPRNQVGPALEALPQSAVALSPSYTWLGNVDAEHSGSSAAVGLVVCPLCNGCLPSDQICSTCFGPFSSTAAYDDATLQDIFVTRGCCMAGCVDTSTPEVPASDSLHQLDSGSRSLPAPREISRLRTPTKKDDPTDGDHKSDQSDFTRRKRTKRKWSDQSSRINNKLSDVVRQSPQQKKKTSKQPGERRLPLQNKAPFKNSGSAATQIACSSCVRVQHPNFVVQEQDFWYCSHCHVGPLWYGYEYNMGRALV
ncbi:MAG: hypothetical protein Q9191_006119 [Dirinaria sp. TL-2023a]